MKDGDVVTLLNVHGDQHFTEPPPRFSEASLVKALEEHGIGRPSTYATIISTLKDREYVDMDNRRFIPTDIGKIVGSFLSKHFHKYVEYGFTAALEDELDAVSRGEEDWTEPLKKFWKPFITQVEHIEKNVSREEVAQARELGKHPESGKPITVRMGRLRSVRADRHQGRRRETEVRRPAPRPEDGPHQAARSARAVQTTASRSARPPKASRCRRTSAASGRTSSTAPSTSR